MPKCEKCELFRTTKTACLKGEGSDKAKILFVKMQPGASDIKQGRPLTGAPYHLLTACLQTAEIDLKDVYITTLVKCKTPSVEKNSGQVEDRKPYAKEIKACMPYLEEKIKKIKPNVIVLLGAEATKAILNKASINNIHGTPYWHEGFNATCIPINSPSYLERQTGSEELKIRQEFIKDLKFIKESAKTKEFSKKKKKKTNYIICDTLPKVNKLLKRLNEIPEFVYDIETTGLKANKHRVLCVSFSWKEGTACVVPIWDWSRGEMWSQEDLAYIKSKLKLIMENPEIKKIGQNISFDTFFLNKKWHWDIKGTYFDTMFAHYLLDPDKKGSQALSDLAWVYTDMGGYDDHLHDDRKNGFENTAWDELYEYSAADSDCEFRVYEALKRELDEGQLRVLTTIMVPLSIVIAEMEYNGVQIDKEYLAEITADFAKRIEEQNTAIYEIEDVVKFSEIYLSKQKKEILKKYHNSKMLPKKYKEEEYLAKNIKPVNFNSPKQLRVLLFEHLGLPVVKKTKKTSEPSTDEASLELLKGEHEFIDNLLELRYLRKIYSTYLNPIADKLDEDGRLHTNYMISRTGTGRLASKNINLQNIPKKKEGKLIRDYFIASPGNVLISSDLRQIEYRILAHFVNDAKQILDLVNGLDIHTEVASDVYKITKEEVTKEQRNNAKAVTFGIPYGRSAVSLADEYGMSPTEAFEFINAFFAKYPKVKLWIDKMVSVARQKGYVRNYFGRKRYLPKMHDKNNFIRGEEERKVVSTCIQGTASDILSIYTINVGNRLKKMKSKAKLVLTIHDDIVLDTPEEEKEQIVKMLREEMQKPIEGIRVPIETEINIGKKWGSLEKYEEDLT